jgi:hypothetical protein
MSFEYLTDSQIQSYPMYKIRLGAHGWSNIETCFLEDELKKTIIHVMSHQSVNQGISSLRWSFTF